MEEKLKNNLDVSVLEKLVVDEQEIKIELGKLVEKTITIFRIEKPSGRILFKNFSSLSDPQRISALLIGKYFASRMIDLGISCSESLNVSNIAKELGRPVTAMSGPIQILLKKGFVEKLEDKTYRISYNRLNEVVNSILNK
jgi:hypothetical protein